MDRSLVIKAHPKIFSNITERPCNQQSSRMPNLMMREAKRAWRWEIYATWGPAVNGQNAPRRSKKKSPHLSCPNGFPKLPWWLKCWPKTSRSSDNLTHISGRSPWWSHWNLKGICTSHLESPVKFDRWHYSQKTLEVVVGIKGPTLQGRISSNGCYPK